MPHNTTSTGFRPPVKLSPRARKTWQALHDRGGAVHSSAGIDRRAPGPCEGGPAGGKEPFRSALRPPTQGELLGALRARPRPCRYRRVSVEIPPSVAASPPGCDHLLPAARSSAWVRWALRQQADEPEREVRIPAVVRADSSATTHASGAPRRNEFLPANHLTETGRAGFKVFGS